MTTAQTIIDAAIASSLANDGGTTVLANNTTELLGVLSRVLRQVYAMAGLPQDAGGFTAASASFVRTGTVTIASPITTPTAFPSLATRLLQIVDAGGDYVSMIALADLRSGTAELPPAVIVADRTLRSAARTGDPTAGAVLTVDYAYVPAALSSASDILGATTPSDATTSSWPSEAGDPFLTHWLARYLSQKDGTRDPAELQQLTALLQQDAAVLAGLLGISAANLVTVGEGS